MSAQKADLMKDGELKQNLISGPVLQEESVGNVAESSTAGYQNHCKGRNSATHWSVAPFILLHHDVRQEQSSMLGGMSESDEVRSSHA